MAPEQLQEAHAVDHRADIYSLGVVFYEMLTGKLPIGRFDPPSKKVHVDVRLDEVVLRSLESEPGRRYQHASELKEQVNMITHSGQQPDGTAPPSRPSQPGGPGFDHGPNNWADNLLGIDPRLGRQLVHVVAAVLGTMAGLLFISSGFNLFRSEYAIFGGIACSMLAGLAASLGGRLFPSDPASVIADSTKLQAALAMSVGPARDQTLVKVARDAAAEGESNVAHAALQSIQDPGVRDEAAAACAQEIADNEGAEAALPVARLIQDNNRRNAVLQKIAEL
jgi:hypothetical protein